MKKIFTLCIVLCLSYLSMGATNLKHEFRATWLTTAWGNDWPKTQVTSDATRKQQQDELIAIFDRLQAGNMNAVCLQVRGRSDAFYQSSYEPWAAELAGARGTNPGYDPLAFAIEEAHKRGLELHAWVNPFRVTSAGTLDANDLVKKNAGQWIIQYNNGSFTGEIIDPGYPEAREYVLNVLMEIISNYDIDGIVMDDYFYPYGGTTTEDAASKALHKPANVVDVNQDGDTDDDWRRSNVDVFLEELYDRIQATKPWVRLGMGTFGIWTTQTKVAQAYGISLPSGISGLDDYDVQACNPVEWVKNGYVDYINPQLYWPTTSTGQNYNKLCQWWAKDVCEHFSDQLTDGKKVHFFSSQSISANPTLSEIQSEIDVNRNNLSSGSTGSVFFDTDAYLTMDNALMTSRFATHALPPAMDWKSNTALAAPTNLTVSGSTLSWQHATAERFTVYVYPKGTTWSTAKNDPSYLQGVIYGKSMDISGIDTNANNIAVCVYDRYGVEHETAIYGAPPGDVTPPASGTITYVLNGGVQSEWENPQAMYNELNAVWNTFSGSTSTWGELETLKANVAQGIPTLAGGMALTFIADENFKAKFEWLVTYMDAKCAEQGQTLPSSNASYLRYNLQAFFIDGVRAGWPVSANYTTCGVSTLDAYQPYWKSSFANPTEPTTEVTLNAPYKEGYTFLGWYANADFSGEKVTTINAETTGTLYAKWINSDWIITYTSTDGNIVTPHETSVFGANIVSNTYDDGQGIIVFDGPVTSIDGSGFWSCTNLTSITIPNSVTSIGDSPFYWCSSLTSVTIPNSVTSIGRHAFGGCSSLNSVVVESGNIYYDSRENCNAIIETVTNTLIVGCQSTSIPNSVTSIGRHAFVSCSSLTSITIPNSVRSIGGSAFYGCSSLTSITIPNSVMSIGDVAFGDCDAITSVVVESGNATYDSRENCNAIIETATNTLISGCQNTTIPNSITSIGESAFYYCRSLTSITIPNSVTSISFEVFSGCDALTSIVVDSGNTTYDSRENCNAIIKTATNTLVAGCQSTIIPNSVTSIGNYAFAWCPSLTSVTIPNSVTSIGNYAFDDCSSLDTIYVEATTPPALEDSTVFRYTPSPVCVIPCGTLAAYEVSDWANYMGEFVEECPIPIVVKAKVPASWENDDITVWVWTDGAGTEYPTTKEGDWYVYTHTDDTEFNIIFKSGTGWKGNTYQTVDINGITENTCLQIQSTNTKATYTIVDCPSIIYELNGGVTNDYGWQSKDDMYHELLVDINAIMLTTKVDVDTVTLAYSKTLSVEEGIPAWWTNLDPLLDDINFMTKWGWLITYMDGICVEQDAALQTIFRGSLFLKYHLAAFFIEDICPYGSVDYSIAGKDEAYIPAWKHGYANPTDPTDEFVLNMPYRECYTFDGWYVDANFAGEQVITVDSSFNGTLYAKWVESDCPIANPVSWELEGGISPVELPTYITSTYVLPTPIRDGYVFMEWYHGNTLGIEIPMTILPIGYTGTLYAQWKKEPTDALNPFAYALSSELSGDRSQLLVNYSLNARAMDVQIVIMDGETAVKTIACDGLSKGSHSIAIPTAGLPEHKQLTWKVEVKGAEVTEPTEYAVNYSFYHPSAVDIDNNPENPTFGMILTNEGMHEVKDINGYLSTGYGAGIYAFNPAFEPMPNGSNPGYNGGIEFTNGRADDTTRIAFAPRRIRISEDGRIFVTSQNTDGNYLWEVNPENMNEWNSIFKGTLNEQCALVDAGGNFIAAPNNGFDVRGAGEDLQLMMYADRVSGSNNSPSKGSYRCDEYNLGTATTWAIAPTKNWVGDKYAYKLRGTQVEYDNEGGIWLAYNSSIANETYPGLVHINKDGVEDVKLLWSNIDNAGIRFNHDFTKMILAGNNGISKKATLYNVSKDINGVPVLTEEFVIDATYILRRSLNDFAFDYAGNLYACGHSTKNGEKIVAWAMPRSADEVITTPAASKYNFIYSDDAITYELNGGVTNDYGWQSKGAVALELQNDYNAAYGTSKEWAKSENGYIYYKLGEEWVREDLVPAGTDCITAGFIAYVTYNNSDNLKNLFAANPDKYGWLNDIIIATRTAAGLSVDDASMAEIIYRYELSAFFLCSPERTSWPGTSSYEVAGTFESFKTIWKQAFANPTNPAEEFVLNAPYKEGYTFAGWYTTPDFSGEKVTTINAETEGTLYVKWVDYIPTIKEVRALADNTKTKVAGVVNHIDGRRIYIQDVTGGILLYTNDTPTCKVGDKIVAEGVRSTYTGAPEIKNAVIEFAETATLYDATTFETLTPLISDSIDHKYFATRVTVPGLKIVSYNASNHPTVADNLGNQVRCYNMPLDPVAFPIGKKVTITAVGGWYSGFQFVGGASAIDLSAYPKKDTYDYPVRAERYTLTNDWVYSNIEGNFAANKPGSDNYVRGMAAKDGIMYFINRENGSLTRVDGATGEMLEPLKITGEHLFERIGENGEWESACIFPFNDIKFDQAGNCLIGSLVAGDGTFQIYEVDLETGAATLVVEERLYDNSDFTDNGYRFDAFGVAGDVTKNGVVMAADAQSWNVYRWLIKNGVVGYGEQINCALNAEIDESLFIETENFGTAPQIFPQDELGELFYVDGASTLPMLFDGDGMLLDDFINVPTGTNVWNSNGDTISINSGHLNGLIEFQVGEEYFLLMAATYSTHNVPSTFALYKFADENRAFSGMEPLWYFPHNGMGSNTNGYRTAVPSVDVIDNNTAKLYLYVGENGYACYTLNVGDKTVEPIDPTWQITYTSSNDSIVTPYATDVFGANIVSNTYENGVGTITFDGPLTSIGNNAFYECSNLTSITIPNSVTSIGDRAFQWCSGLTSITIPDSVTSIGEYAFRICDGLTSITIPNSVTSIRSTAFSHCKSIVSMVVADANAVYDSRNGCNAIIETATNTLVAGCQNTIIPNSVTKIGESAFNCCYGLTSIAIPNSVTEIGGDAFSYCSSLSSVTIPNSVTSIGSFAFGFCINLASVFIPNSITNIESTTFYSCTSLTSITIPNSVTHIGHQAFLNCTSLTTIHVEATTPPALEDSTVFMNTPSPICVIPCGTLAAYQASDWASQVSEFVEEGCVPIQMCGDDLYWEYADGVLTITGTGDMYDYADGANVPWYDVRGNIKTVILPDAMTKIGQNAFYKCTEVTSINMPTTLTAIGEKAFAQDTRLACEIILPASMTTIASRAFFNCQAVTAFHIEATTPPTIPNDAFERTTAPIHVPCGYGHIYGKHAQWGELNLEMCELLQDNVYYYPIDGHTARAVTYYSNPTDTIVIPSAVVIDGMPRTVTEVADFAFMDCANLPAIYFSEGLEYIGERAFVRCYGLQGTIVLPATLETIGERAFSYCNNVDRYTIQAMTPPVLGANVFTGDNKNALFYISCEAMDDYTVATNWSSLKSRLRDACLNIYHYNTALGANGVHTTEDTLVASIYYRRQFTTSRWETLYLPFEVDRVTVLEDGVEYDLNAWSIFSGGHYYLAKPYGIENKELVFGFTQVVDAHTPYIIQFKEPYYHDKMITFHGKESWNKLNTSFEALPISFEMQMAGNTTLQDQILEEPVYMLRASSNFILQNTTTTLHPFECYVMPYATSSGAPARMSVRFRGDVPTAVESVKGNESHLTYTVDGYTLTVYPQGQAFSIYSLNGALIYSCEAGKEAVDCELNSGCYLLHAGAEAHKIML